MNKLLAILALALLIHQPALAETEASNPVLATVAEHAITKQDLLNYGRESPYLLPYLSIPGGPMKILNDMINERLLILEGERLGIAKGETSSPAYAYQVRSHLAPACPIPDEGTAKSYYEEHPEKFSTPIFLRLYRFGLPFTAENESAVFNQLSELGNSVRRGETTLADAVANGKNESMVVRQGDLGFLPYDDTDNPIMKELTRAPINQIVGPLKQKDWFFLYQVTDRREPILASYERIKDEAAKVEREECSRLKFKELLDELKQRWPVRMLVDEIDVRPERK
jgi:hypothetical protein